MKYSIVLIVVVLVIMLLIRGFRKKVGVRTVTHVANSDTENEPRDFLQQAGSIFRSPKPLAVLLQESEADVIQQMIELLKSPNTMARKAAAYALGQIGKRDFLPILEQAATREQAKGVREAMEASLVAIQRLSSEDGHSELERRRMIDNVYYGRG